LLSLGLGIYPALFFMTFSSSIIEEWLLSGKAVYKNLSCGNAGLVQIPVPENRTFIITKIEILPFANIFDDAKNFASDNTFYQTQAQDLEQINQRSQYQLLFWNERMNNSWNIRNEFSINVNEVGGLNKTTPSNIYKKNIIDCFMVVETNSWLYLKYIDFVSNPNLIYQDNYGNIFNGSQNWPPSPFFGYSNQDDIANFANAFGASFDYVPQGYNTNYGTPEFNSDQYTLPSLDTSLDPNQFSSFIPPFALGGSISGGINSEFINSIPLYNVEYIEVNRRLSTTGLL
jgi:hypothetical protein